MALLENEALRVQFISCGSSRERSRTRYLFNLYTAAVVALEYLHLERCCGAQYIMVKSTQIARLDGQFTLAPSKVVPRILLTVYKCRPHARRFRGR